MQPYLPEFYTGIITTTGIIIGLAGVLIGIFGTVLIGPYSWRVLMMALLSGSIALGIIAVFQTLEWYMHPNQIMTWLEWILLAQLVLLLLPLIAFISTYFVDQRGKNGLQGKAKR